MKKEVKDKVLEESVERVMEAIRKAHKTADKRARILRALQHMNGCLEQELEVNRLIKTDKEFYNLDNEDEIF